MDDKELRIELETRLTRMVQNFVGQQISQEFIAAIWDMTFVEVRKFNDEYTNFHQDAVMWIHSQYLNRAIQISISGEMRTIGSFTDQNNGPKISAIALVDLYRMRKMFENSLIEGDIVAEIKDRLNDDGKTDKQTSRGSFSTDN